MSNTNVFNLVSKTKLALAAGVIMLSSSQVFADVLNPVIGSLIYEDNFSSINSTVWNTIDGDGCSIGLCGWGNQELEYYSPNNVAIEDVPFEPGTKALAIQARRENVGSHVFTSGKITTENKLQIKYGLTEIRMSTPQVGTGLWPAAWMLGTSLETWPAKGEIDIMEMGHSAAAMAGAGLAGSDINSYVGSNVIFYATGACSSGNPTCAASTSWQTTNAYVAHTPLINRFVTYRLYWTDSQIRFTVIDNGVEHDMYKSPIPITSEAAELQAPFYLLFNLAVGGNFTDALTNGQVTAPLPGKMYIDYVRVYQLDGKGEVKIGNQVLPETGTFGVFTDNTPTSKKQVPGVSSDIWIWNTASVTAGTIPAYEGSNAISWKYMAPNQWFGGGISSRQPHDMSNFVNGNLKFRIKVPANVAFKIGVQDTYTNQNWVNFPANQTTYGLVRNGEWAQATIPVSVVRGSLVALQSLSALFNIASIDGQLPTANFEMAIDDVVWECGNSAACQTAVSSSSVPSSRSSSSIVESRSSSSVPKSSSSVAPSSIPKSSSSAAPSSIPKSSSSAASSNGYTVLSGSSIRFFANGAPWADIHYTVNGGAQQNVRMTVNGTNNSYDVTGLANGAVVQYFLTVGIATGGAYDTAWANVTCCGTSTSSAAPSSVAVSSKPASSVAASSKPASSAAPSSVAASSKPTSSAAASSIASGCTSPQYAAGKTYATGAKVKNVGYEYTCTVGGWCTIGGPYEPGVGWAWTNAWTQGGVCN